MAKKHNAGFTLTEVLIGIIVAVIFISVAIIGYTAVTNNKNEASVDASVQSSNGSKEKQYFEFSELGVKFEKTNSNRGMTFKQSEDGSSYRAYDRILNTISRACYGEQKDVSFGSIIRGEGYGGDTGKPGVKQFGDFGIKFEPAQNIQPCTDSSHQDRFTNKIQALQNQLSYSITGAEKL